MDSIQTKLHLFISIKTAHSQFKPFLLSEELLDLYTFWFGQKKLVRSEPSRMVKDSKLSHHLNQPQLSKLIGCSHFTILLQTRFLNLNSVLNFSLLEKFEIENFDFLKYKYEIRITVFSIEFTATVSLLEIVITLHWCHCCSI